MTKGESHGYGGKNVGKGESQVLVPLQSGPEGGKEFFKGGGKNACGVDFPPNFFKGKMGGGMANPALSAFGHGGMQSLPPMTGGASAQWRAQGVQQLQTGVGHGGRWAWQPDPPQSYGDTFYPQTKGW